jgi:hypothetical protein
MTPICETVYDGRKERARCPSKEALLIQPLRGIVSAALRAETGLRFSLFGVQRFRGAAKAAGHAGRRYVFPQAGLNGGGV